MVVEVPTLWYVGDPQINGGYSLPQTNFPYLWGFQLNDPTISQVYPAGPDGVTGGTYEPYWDGSFNSGNGSFVKYAHTPSVPGAKGDNWYTPDGGGISPMTLLMRGLCERYPNAPGHRVLKLSVNGGFGTGAEPLKPGSAGWSLVMAEWVKMQAAAALVDQSLRLDFVVVDATVTDLIAGSFSYAADIQAFVDGVTAINPDVKIILVTHKFDMRSTSIPNLAALGRELNRGIANANPGTVVLFDMSWAAWGSDSPFLIFQEGPDKTQYRVMEYVEAGARIARLINNITAGTPVIGTVAPVVSLIGDSQFLTVGSNGTFATLTNQQSVLGNLGGTDQEAGYIWNNVVRMVEFYDVLSNGSTFGDVGAWYGPEATLLAGLSDEFPNGLFIFKFAKSGMPLTVDAILAAGATPPYSVLEKAAELTFNDIRLAWADCKLALQRDLGLTAQCIAVGISIGANDILVPAALAAKLPTFTTDIRELFSTESDPNRLLPIFYVQPPPHEESGAKWGTGYGTLEARNQIRATIAAEHGKPGVYVLFDPGGKYELIRFEKVHYSNWAVHQLGYDLAELILSVIRGDGGTTTEVVAELATTDLPSEVAAFTVEDGSGLPSANSLASVEFTTQYAQENGNPASWALATLTKHRDCLRQATRWVNLRYRYCGRKVDPDQGCVFPRFGLSDEDGYYVPSDSVPLRVQQAVAVVAIRICDGTWAPFPDEEAAGGVTGGSITVGPISISDPSSGARTTITEVRLMVATRLLSIFVKQAAGKLGRG